MWIDALCINQKDRDERSQQVKLMGAIYRGAAQVIAWLGPDDDDDGPAAFGLLEALSDAPDRHLDERMSPHLAPELLWPESIEALMRLLDGRWWRRVWTFQEMVLAARLEFRRGSRSLPGAKLAAAHENFWSHNACCYSAFAGEYPGHPLADLDKYLGRLSRIYDFASLTEDIVFPAVMVVFRQRECSDPRDKVFGYLGLAFGRFQNYVEPNYKKAVSAVLEETALKIMERIESLGPFSLLEGPRSRKLGCPSWVPTWEELRHDFIFEAYHIRLKWLVTFNACRKKPLDLVPLRPGKVKVRGIIVDQVGNVGGVPPHHPIKHQTAIYDGWHAIAQCSTTVPYRDQQATREEAFWLTLLNGSLHEDASIPPAPEENMAALEQDGHATSSALVSAQTSRASLAAPAPGENVADPERAGHATPSALGSSQTSRESQAVDSDLWPKWWAFMHSPSGFLDVDTLDFNTCVTAATISRIFFVTVGKEGDWMGTGPPATRPDDLVVVLNGGVVPHVLRPTGSAMKGQDGEKLPQFLILGDCYVHGIMHGEAMDRLDEGQYQEQDFVLV